MLGGIDLAVCVKSRLCMFTHGVPHHVLRRLNQRGGRSGWGKGPSHHSWETGTRGMMRAAGSLDGEKEGKELLSCLP